ncbi:MAG TPA: hypothetical protein HA315_03525 [Candidatus Thalassarchaeaceae archaeon]|jgi:uncharacterized coiled-coil DUF342 family protein|nr:hypothetical protein [Euryarchaeota archaeon]DAC43404.1 MAG TPA: hypothetical protein D7H72_03515 [Candidatus Poseidoniales archaeon]HII35051.1 hypothetical protein [Candidatus Thalassarchaeaceae archaeon]|tara:strand:- start:27078 stop:28046 length:969 start_codon:yes stop_codon:yes gene_type:complete
MSEEDLASSFSDLEDLDGHEVQEMRSGLDRDLGSLDGERKDLRSERMDLVNRVTILRGVVGKMEGANSERKGLLRRFHEIKKAADSFRKKRDDVNRLIPPPMDVLKEWLSETHRRLTTIDNDLTAVPTLSRELEAFRRFFEIQASIVKKSESEQAHSEYIEKAKEMRDVTVKLDEGRKEKRALESESTSESGDENKASRSEVRKISKRITKIDKRMESIDSKRKSLRKSLSRVKAYQRITGGRNRKVRFSEIKAKAKTGGSLSTVELDALLGSGSLSELTDGGSGDIRAENTAKGQSGKRKRRIGVSRRGPRKGNLATKRDD